MNALIKELKREALKFGISFAVFAATLKIVFIGESLLTVIRAAAGFYWLYVLPGFALVYCWRGRLAFIERLIIGSVLGLAAVGVIGYNLSALGLHMKYHAILLPLLITGVACIFILKNPDRMPEPEGEATSRNQHHEHENQG